jgi:ABC-2 type transport system permease protein
MQRFAVLFHSLLTINLRNRVTLFWNFAFPVGLLLLYGAIWGGERMGDISAITWLMIGIIVLNIMSSGFIGDSAWLTQTREQGILLRVQATPLPTAHLISAYLLVRLVMVTLQSALIIAVAMLLFGAQINAGGIVVALLLALFGAMVFIALGQAIASIAPTSQASAAIGQCIYFPLMFISNLFMPLEMMPSWIGNIARWNPAYMLVDLVRPALVSIPANQAAWLNLTGLLIYGLLGMMIAARFFRWEPKR